MLSQALLLREGFSAIWVWADVFKVEGLDILFRGVCDLDCFVDMHCFWTLRIYEEKGPVI